MDKFLRNRFATSKKTKVGTTYAYLFDHRGPISMSVFFKAGPEYYGTSLKQRSLFIYCIV